MKGARYIGKTLLVAALALASQGAALAKEKGAGASLRDKPTKSVKANTKGSKSSSKALSSKKKKARPASLHDRLVLLKKGYRLGEISRRSMWEQLAWLHERGQRLSDTDRVSLLQTQAIMLQEGGYPILAAIYASQALKISSAPLAADAEPAWTVLRRASEKQPIQSVLEIVADTVDLKGKPAPVFGSDWWYYAGNAAARRGENDKALAFYGDLETNDRYFFPGKYQQAMIYVDQNKYDQAESTLKAVLNPQADERSPLPADRRRALQDYARLGLGRLYYERERFVESAKMYRAVARDGASFYDSLFEQSWAFFLGGYPMHALGGLHAVESPFYAEVFNPEAPILRALVHYWLCRYEDSRNALADFSEKYAPAVEKLDEFLDRQRLDSETAYQMFENLVSGVSGDALGVPKSILQTAAEKDSMLLVRDQYAAILEEKSRLESKGVYGSKSSNAKPLDYLDRWGTALRKDVGKRFLAELQDMKKDYDRLYSQAQFLYVELLMSEKDQLLGKELHASSKITAVSKKMKVGGWADKTQAWKDARYGEYWWDEVGWYIAPVEAKCNLTH
jgi:hypothetical protein